MFPVIEFSFDQCDQYRVSCGARLAADWLTAALLPPQGSDKEHREEEAVRGQPSPHFLRLSEEDRQENRRRHDAGPRFCCSGDDRCANLAGCSGNGDAEQPLPGSAHQETEDSR